MSRFLQTTFVLIFFSNGLCFGQVSQLWDLDSMAKGRMNDSVSKAIELANQELALAKSLKNKEFQCRALNTLANAHLINDDYGLALENCLDALELAQLLNETTSLASIYTTLGWLHYDIKDTEQALKFHQQALDLWKKTSDSLSICVSLNAVGLSFSQAGQFEKALPYFNKSLDMGGLLNNSERKMAAMNNIGDAQLALGDNLEALHWFDLAEPLAKRNPDVLREAELLNSKASALVALGNFKEAKSLLSASHSLIAKSSSNAGKEIEMRNAWVSALLYKKINLYDSAFKALELHNDLREQILSDAKRMSLTERKEKWKTKKSEAEILKLKQERELRDNQRNAIAGAIIILTVIGFFVYSRERQLRIKESQLAEAKAALDRAEIEKANIEKEALNNKIEFKNKELTNYALHISQRNDLQQNFLSELENLKGKASQELLSHLNKVVKQFGNTEEINKEAEEFHVNVELENKDFFYNLKEKFPDLTENERRLCAQVRLNLSIKDIASINATSVKAVEMARYRLRKKLGIQHDDSLPDFLNRL